MQKIIDDLQDVIGNIYDGNTDPTQLIKRLEKIVGEMSQLQKQTDQYDAVAVENSKRLTEGRHYLMGVSYDQITVEDALEAFGFGRDGLNF